MQPSRNTGGIRSTPTNPSTGGIALLHPPTLPALGSPTPTADTTATDANGIMYVVDRLRGRLDISGAETCEQSHSNSKRKHPQASLRLNGSLEKNILSSRRSLSGWMQLLRSATSNSDRQIRNWYHVGREEVGHSRSQFCPTDCISSMAVALETIVSPPVYVEFGSRFENVQGTSRHYANSLVRDSTGGIAFELSLNDVLENES